MTNEQRIKLAETIEHRINAEYRKHKDLDWAKIASLKLADFMIENSYLTADATAEEMSKITNSHVGSVHWYRSILSKIKDIGEFLSAETPKEEYLRVWGKELFEGSLELLRIENNPALQRQPQPTEEGAEEIYAVIEKRIERFFHSYQAYEAKDLITALEIVKRLIPPKEFAALHAQKIADKMVSERLREELISCLKWVRGWTHAKDVQSLIEKEVDSYFKNRSHE